MIIQRKLSKNQCWKRTFQMNRKIDSSPSPLGRSQFLLFFPFLILVGNHFCYSVFCRGTKTLDEWKKIYQRNKFDCQFMSIFLKQCHHLLKTIQYGIGSGARSVISPMNLRLCDPIAYTTLYFIMVCFMTLSSYTCCLL